MINTPLYTGKNIELTELDPEKDGPVIAGWIQNPSTYARIMQGKYHLASNAEVIKSLTDALKKSDERKDSFYFAVRTRSEQKLIGFARFPVVIGIHQFGNLRIDFENTDSLSSFGSEVLGMMAYFGFMELNLFRIVMRMAGCETELIAQFEQFGFNQDVCRREAVFHSGRYFDELVYGMNRPAYDKLHSEVKND